MRPFPAWAKALVAALFIYTGVNFFLAMPHLPQKGATVTDDAHQIAVYTMRAFSGHWLFFYAIPTLFFLFVLTPSVATSSGVSPTRENQRD